jgi:glycosyltransferase involved in cell wall biosynthesis
MRKKVLFISYFYPPVGGLGLPGAQRTIKFLRYLNSIEPYVLTLKTDRYPSGFTFDNNAGLPVNNEQIFRTGDINIFKFILNLRGHLRKLLPSKGFKEETERKNKFFLTDQVQATTGFQKFKDIISSALVYPDQASPWLVPAIFQGYKIIKQKRIDIIFATGMPWTSLIVGFILKKMTGAKFIADFRDPWVNNPFIQNKFRFERFFDSRLESSIVKSADIAIANTDSLRQEMEERYPRQKNKIVTLPNGYDPFDFKDIPIYPITNGKFIISHAGFLYSKRDPMPLLNAMEIIKNEHPELISLIEFYQIGGVNLSYDIIKECRKKGINENLKLIGQLTHKNCLGYLQSSDALLLLQPDTKTQIPSKLYEYIYLNKPILTITGSGSAVEQLIQTHNFGKVFNPQEEGAISEYILTMLQNKFQKAAMPDSHENSLNFDIRNISKNLEKIIELQ